MNSEHYRGLERMYLLAPYNQELYEGNHISISEGQAEITTTVSTRHFHGGGTMHGSCYFRMLDDAAFFAVNSLIEDFMVYTVSFNINLTRPVGTGIIKSVGKVKHRSKNIYIAESTLYDKEGRILAFGTGEFMNSPISPGEIPGYLPIPSIVNPQIT